MAASEHRVGQDISANRQFAIHLFAANSYIRAMLDALKPLPEDPAELHGHRKARFGSKSESLDQLAFGMTEDAEIEGAAEAQKYEPAEADSKPPNRQHSRKPLPDHLDRQDEVLSAGEECGECGGSLRQIGEDGGDLSAIGPRTMDERRT